MTEPRILLLKRTKREAYDKAMELLKVVNLSSKLYSYPTGLYMKKELPNKYSSTRKKPLTQEFFLLLCDETNMQHKMNICLDGIEGNPLEEPFSDELNKSIFTAHLQNLVCEKTNDLWQLSFVIEP